MNIVVDELKGEIKKRDAELKEKKETIKKQSTAIYNAVRILLEAGVPVQKIANSTGMSIVEIERIKVQENI